MVHTERRTAAVRNSHCSWCGGAFPEWAGWPRTCQGCGQVSYLNPLPVAVLLLPVDDGLLVVRRAIEPGLGKLALPGGFIDLGESWQEAAARELSEETGATVPAEDIRLYDARSAPDGTLLVFGAAPPRTAGDLPPPTPTGETAGWEVLDRPTTLAFPLHTAVVARFFAERQAGRHELS